MASAVGKGLGVMEWRKSGSEIEVYVGASKLRVTTERYVDKFSPRERGEHPERWKAMVLVDHGHAFAQFDHTAGHESEKEAIAAAKHLVARAAEGFAKLLEAV